MSRLARRQHEYKEAANPTRADAAEAGGGAAERVAGVSCCL